MALSATEIEGVLHEIVPVLVGGRLQKIHQPNDRVLVFEWRVPGETHRLLVSCEPATARLHFVSRPSPNPASPPSFCQFLRAQVQGSRLDDISQFDNERIVTLAVTTRRGPRTIVCELTGQTANMLVLDEQQLVLRDLNAQRPVVGHPYEAPQRRSGPPRHVAARFTGPTTTDRFPVSRAVEDLYQDQARDLAVNRATQDRLRMLRKALAKLLRRIDAWREDLAKAAAFRDYGRYGELLKANLAAIRPGVERITLVDYYDPSLPEVTIPLDRTKSALYNMNDYFKKHRKSQAADRELSVRIAHAEPEVDSLRREIASIEEGTWTPPPLDDPLAQTGRRDQSRRPSTPRRQGPFRRFVSADGLPIFVGRNAAENEELTFRMAKSDDLWLHARGTPGSHVIVRLAKGTDPPLDTLRDAATLALLYSDLKRSGKGDVIYTRRKWVKKAKGQAPGAVTVTQEHTISVKLDALRLAALKERIP